jgi:hypothetical protein
MIGAYCHRLNLAATHWTNDAFDGKLQTCLDRIHAVMIRASNLKVGAEVRKYTDRKPTIRNKTRCMGNQNMAISYGHLHEPFTASRQFASIIPSDYVDIHDDGTSNKVPPILLNSTEKKAF